jgi:hypothetical protein
VALLEAKTRKPLDSDDSVLLSPYDATILIIERANLDESPESAGRGRRINALLNNHDRAMRRCRPRAMTPEDAALREASERDENSETAEKYRLERLAALLAM